MPLTQLRDLLRMGDNKMHLDVRDILNSGLCCGCLACLAICPKDAISKSSDSFGYVVPKLDDSKCIQCALCMCACPMQETVKGTGTEC